MFPDPGDGEYTQTSDLLGLGAGPRITLYDRYSPQWFFVPQQKTPPSRNISLQVK